MRIDDLYRPVQPSPQAEVLQRLARPAGTGAPATPEDARLKEAAQEFEQYFLQLLLKQARQTTQALRGEEASQERQTYEEWQDESIARSIASGQGIGLGEQLYRQLIESQLRNSK
jgi:Rod binding domain-containing protein